MGTDAAEFRRLAAVVRGPGTPADRLADADRALALWRSDPFPDLLDDPAFAVAAEGLRETHETVAEDRTDILLRLGHHEVAVTDLVELVARDPLRERRSRLLMLALYRSGRQGEALAVYQSLRRRLRDELGIDPGEDTRRLEMDILRHARRLKLPGDTAGSLAPRAAAVGPHPDAAVRIMTAQRLAVLPDDVAALVRMMAVLDDLAEPAVLASALGWDRPRLDAASHEAHVHGLLNDGAGNLRLAVDIREGVLSGLHLPELARLNACAGRALASGHPTTERVARAAWHLLAGDAMNPATGTTVLDAMHRLLSDGQLEALRALGNRAITLTSGAVQRQYWPAIFEMLTEAGDAPGPEGAPRVGFTRIERRAADAQARVILLRHSADVSARKDLAKQVARLARGSSDPYWRFAPVMNCIFEAGRAGDLTELEVLCDQMSDIVERGPSGRLRWLHWLTVAVLHLDRGELAASDRASERAAREGTAGGVADAVHVHAFQQCVAAFHRRSIGPFAPYVEEMLATTPSLSFAWAVLTLAHAQLGDRERTLAEAARTWQRLVDDPTDEYRPFSVAVLIQALAELAPDARLPLPLLRDLTDALAPFAGQFVTAGSILASAGPARRYLGLAAWLRGDRIGAETLLWAAATEASDHGMPLWRLRSLTDLVRVLADGDAHTEASALAATLHPEASTLGLTPCLATLHAALD